MLQYTIGKTKKGGIDSVSQKKVVKHLFLFLILILLIIGWGLSGKSFVNNWFEDKYCNDRLKFPLHVSGLFVYLTFILWFIQFPTRENESIQSIFT